MHARLEVPPLGRAGPAQRPAYGWVDAEQHRTELRLDDRTHLQRDRILLVRDFGKRDLGAEAELEGQPVLGDSETRPYAPAHELTVDALASRRDEIARELEVVGDAAGE